ncbi:TIM barrel protein [candidate division KSB3 bacterium]|uniref:TIM barrel protein n=1 Tax=candidate division KSB3 bacterium TaxID=2044937 RepID=A0A9D5JS29_9BACT|nr:TIM barrel protein [candidate division KSB3 bacterium]MBD3323210.1 TIM barrel protein [candidate division KSB3 bacterium]
MELKQAIIMAFMGQLKDRFCEYHEARAPEQKIAAIAQVSGAKGVEIVFPYELQDIEGIKRALKTHDLGVAAVNVNVKSEPEFAKGSVSVNNKKIRQKAIQFIRDGMDVAAELGADKVTCCPLSDGYDYLFQVNYRDAWKNMISTFKEAATHRRDIRLFMEYKASETRVQCFLDSAAKAVCLALAINEPNIGVTIDVGHALIVGETPAESVCLLQSSGIPYYIHINDNDRRGDWDLIPATRNLWDYLEFLYYLKEFGYNDWVTSDMSPMRVDPKAAFERTIATTDKLMRVAESLDADTLTALMDAGKTVETLKWLEDQVLK